jgi:hypothetical protein
MVSVDRLLDDHEVAVRALLEQCDRELADAGARRDKARCELEKVVTTKEMLAKLLAGGVQAAPVPAGVGESAAGVAAGVGIVPDMRADLGADALPGAYRMLYLALATSSTGMKCKALSVAVGFGDAHTKVEGVRAKLKKLIARGWVVCDARGVFTAVG